MRFPDQKCDFFYKFKDIKGFRGGVRGYAAQEIPQVDAEIVKKGHFWLETNYL